MKICLSIVTLGFRRQVNCAYAVYLRADLHSVYTACIISKSYLSSYNELR